jgi:hypothetical protein
LILRESSIRAQRRRRISSDLTYGTAVRIAVETPPVICYIFSV